MTGSDRTRRTALKLIGATAAIAGLPAPIAAQDEDETNETDDETDEAVSDDEETDQQPIILAGRSEYWYGIAPEEIEGEENPDLNLEEGGEYDLVWINVDGAEHELIVESEEGEELEASDSSETAGEAVSMTIEADEDAAEYYCEYHPEEMRGAVELDGGFDLSASEHEEHHEGMEPDDETDNESSDTEIEY